MKSVFFSSQLFLSLNNSVCLHFFAVQGKISWLRNLMFKIAEKKKINLKKWKVFGQIIFK